MRETWGQFCEDGYMPVAMGDEEPCGTAYYDHGEDWGQHEVDMYPICCVNPDDASEHMRTMELENARDFTYWETANLFIVAKDRKNILDEAGVAEATQLEEKVAESGRRAERSC